VRGGIHHHTREDSRWRHRTATVRPPAEPPGSSSSSIVLAIAGRIVSGVWGDATAPYADAAIATTGWDVFLVSVLGALLSCAWVLARPAR
jgi:hypothetical protein